MTIQTRTTQPPQSQIDTLVKDLREMINQTKGAIASAVNHRLGMLYWSLGNRVRKEILKNTRAEYGEEIVASVARQLTLDYGKGFSEKSLRRMIQFGELFPDEQIVASLMRQLSWTHFTLLLPIKDPLKRDFYAEMCRVERWNVRTLQKKIDSMLFERTALSKKPEELVRLELDALCKEDQLAPDLVFRDPYVLEFLKLNDHYVEKDLEDAIMRELEQFFLELGIGFSFLARQKRIIVDSTDFYIDLLFFHRRLRRLVVIELKLGDFKPEYKGQMELYLRWLDKYERAPGEEAPMGLILCTGKNQECIELLELGKAGIHVAEYLTALPSKEALRQTLQNAAKRAKKRLQETKDGE
ncbi:MAG: cytoplasmic protein [Chlamydiae bacterium RIFCSPHIGHO2_12_FULL_49_11]|nr:MAG: cytoplasmic protein [Chlamydiae bacterium RIFCSPHIGHO2_12_FULL_49_11]